MSETLQQWEARGGYFGDDMYSARDARIEIERAATLDDLAAAERMIERGKAENGGRLRFENALRAAIERRLAELI
jgi:hypothetical protein